MPKIFISYRRDDAAYVANILADRLRTTFGDDAVFIDIDTIPYGIDFREHIRNAVAKCDVLLAIIGAEWQGHDAATGSRRIDDPGDFVRIEIEAAIGRNIPVIPVLIDNTKMPSATDLPEPLQPLAFRNAAELRAGRDLNHHLDLLLRGLQQHLAPGTSGSGRPASEAPPEKPAATGTATLRFVRDTGWFGKLVAFNLRVNDNLIGVLRSGETLDYPVKPGTHRLVVTGGGALHGANLVVSITANQTRTVKVGYTATGGVKLTEA